MCPGSTSSLLLSRLLAQPPWMGFGAVIKSAASAASPKNQKKSRKNRKQIDEKLSFWAQKAPSGAQMLVSGALRRQKPAFTKLAASQTHLEPIPNIPNPSQTHPNPSRALPGAFSTIAAPFPAIFGRASGQIYGKKPKNSQKTAFFGLLYWEGCCLGPDVSKGAMPF